MEGGQNRGGVKGRAKGGERIDFDDFGTQALERGGIEDRQMEAPGMAMPRYIRRGGRVWIGVFPHNPVTQKPAETRMG